MMLWKQPWNRFSAPVPLMSPAVRRNEQAPASPVSKDGERSIEGVLKESYCRKEFVMKRFKRLGASLLAAMMLFSLTMTALAAGPATDPGETGEGSITISNAVVGAVYHAYKLFDVTYGTPYEDSRGKEITPTNYIASAEQKASLEEADGNVFDFTLLSGGRYQVTVQSGKSEADVTLFIKSFAATISGGVTGCYFPGAVDAGSAEADSSTVTIANLPTGYYFVTSSQGSVVTITTLNPHQDIIDKNAGTPSWPEDPNPGGPVKDVQNSSGQSINGDKVSVGDTLTYVITYQNANETALDEVKITDAAPEGTAYAAESASAKTFRVSDGGTLEEAADASSPSVSYDAETGTITWTAAGLPAGVILYAEFQVTVADSALTLENKLVENQADVKVTIGETSYELTTNTVENPVGKAGDPEKDVTNEHGDSIEGAAVKVGDVLTYEITYKNPESAAVDLTIQDAPPTGTAYVAGSAKAEIDGKALEDCISMDSDNTITWTIEGLARGQTVTASFQVEVTPAALSIVRGEIQNTAYVTIGDNDYTTNTVKNSPEGAVSDPGKVIVNGDGTEVTESTGAYGDRVNFKVSIDAKNLIAVQRGEGGDAAESPEQVTDYYIYDKLGYGFTLEELTAVTIDGETYPLEEDTENPGKWTAKGAGGTEITFYVCENPDEDDTLIMGTIPWTAQPDGGTRTGLYPDCRVELTYGAVINEAAEIAGDGNKNIARFDCSTEGDANPYKPDPGQPEYPGGAKLNHGSDEKTTTTYTYALGIQKISAETGEALEGAQFLAQTAGGEYICAKENEDGTYSYSGVTDDQEAASVFVSDGSGQIVIKGVNIGTYTFTEVDAPDGYNLLTEPAEITVQMDSADTVRNRAEWQVTRYFEAIEIGETVWEDYAGAVYTYDAENDIYVLTGGSDGFDAEESYYQLTHQNHSSETEAGGTVITFQVNVSLLEVENSSGAILPGTGGMGTALLYTAGTILVLGAGILLIVRRRMCAEETDKFE